MDFIKQNASDHTATDLRHALSTETEEARPTLQMLTGMDAGRLIPLNPGTTVLGRALSSQVILNDESVSRVHAEIRTDSSGAPMIYDCNSKNGTRINGEPLPADGKALLDGDQIHLSANTSLKFCWQRPADEALQGSLYHCAVKDWLTDTHNKRYFLERITQEFSYADRHDRSLSLLFLDVDHFKNVNDKYGHSAGDHVLRRLSQFMKTQLRSEDVLARYGGEEFAILLRQIDQRGAVLVAERLRAGIKRISTQYMEHEIICTVSIGVACTSKDDCEDATELFKLADERLYLAKEMGRDRTVFAEPGSPDSDVESFFRRRTSPPKDLTE